MVILGEVKSIPGPLDLGRDLSVLPRRSQRALIRLSRVSRHLQLLIRRAIQSAPVLRPAIVSLPITLRRVMRRPVHRQQIRERHDLRVVDHPNALGVSRASAANLLVRRVLNLTRNVPHRRRPNPWDAPEHLLAAPEAPGGGDEARVTGRDGRDVSFQNEMFWIDLHRYAFAAGAAEHVPNSLHRERCARASRACVARGRG